MRDLKISKELLEKVLERNIVSFTIHTGFIFIQEKSISHNLNTYEFAFKCKEWAFKNGFNIFSSCKSFSVFQNGVLICSSYGENNEIEAIINACESILEQIKCN